MIMSLAPDHGPEERERVNSLCEQCPVSGCLLLFLLLGLVSYRKGKTEFNAGIVLLLMSVCNACGLRHFLSLSGSK